MSVRPWVASREPACARFSDMGELLFYQISAVQPRHSVLSRSRVEFSGNGARHACAHLGACSLNAPSIRKIYERHIRCRKCPAPERVPCDGLTSIPAHARHMVIHAATRFYYAAIGLQLSRISGVEPRCRTSVHIRLLTGSGPRHQNDALGMGPGRWAQRNPAKSAKERSSN